MNTLTFREHYIMCRKETLIDQQFFILLFLIYYRYFRHCCYYISFLRKFSYTVIFFTSSFLQSEFKPRLWLFDLYCAYTKRGGFVDKERFLFNKIEIEQRIRKVDITLNSHLRVSQNFYKRVTRHSLYKWLNCHKNSVITNRLPRPCTKLSERDGLCEENKGVRSLLRLRCRDLES